MRINLLLVDPIILSGIIVMVGVLILGSTVNAYINARRSVSFSSVSGNLLDLQFTGKAKDSKTGLVASYEYRYEGKKYNAHKIAYFSIHHNQAALFHSQLLQGNDAFPFKIDVYVNHNKPEQSVLIKGLSPKRWYLDLFNGCVFFLACVFISVAAYFSG